MRKILKPVVYALAVATMGIPSLHAAPAPSEGARYAFLERVESDAGVVASESAEASTVGIAILRRGGNAIDAAVAMVFAIGVTQPGNCGLGAGGLMLYHGQNGTVAALDFRERAPLAANSNTFNLGPVDGQPGAGTDLSRPGFHNKGYGHLIVGVPGMVAGMDAAWQRFGSGAVSWQELVQPAEDLARFGMKVSRTQEYAAVERMPDFANYPETMRVFGTMSSHGPIPHPLENVQNPLAPFKQEDNAKSLFLVKKYGPAALYTVQEFAEGPSVGALIVKDMATAEERAKVNPVLMANTGGNPYDVGLLNQADLEAYQPVWREPVTTKYAGRQVWSVPPPSGGGILVIEALNLLGSLPLREPLSAETIHLMAEAQKIARSDVTRHVADPDFVDVPTERLTSQGYAKQRAKEIGEAAKPIEDYGGSPSPAGRPSTHTTHISVLDRAGNAVAVTCSLNGPFGSLVVPEGAGFFLNNHMGDFDLLYGDGDPAPINSVGPGKRPRSNMSPTIVAKEGTVLIATGGAGGPTIPMGVVQQVVDILQFDMDIFHAIDAPRFDATAADFVAFSGGQTCSSSQLAVEHLRFPESVLRELESVRKHSLCRVSAAGNLYVITGLAADDGYAVKPFLNSVGTDLTTGLRQAVSDPRIIYPFEGETEQGAMPE